MCTVHNFYGFATVCGSENDSAGRSGMNSSKSAQEWLAYRPPYIRTLLAAMHTTSYTRTGIDGTARLQRVVGFSFQRVTASAHLFALLL